MSKANSFLIKTIFLIVLTVTAISGTLIISNKPQKVKIKTDYMDYSNVSSLAKTADVIIIGEVVKVNEPTELIVGQTTNYVTNQTEPVKSVYTVSEVKIKKVIKGTLNIEDTISIKQLGGKLDNINYRTEDVYLKEGEKHVFFLAQYNNSPYSLLNPHQGKTKIENGKIKNGDEKIVKNGITEDEFIKNILKSQD